MSDTTQKIATDAAKQIRYWQGGITEAQITAIIQSAIEKATEETNAANCSLLALAAIVKGHPDTPESLKAIASKELLDHTRGAYLINELRTLRAAHASEQSRGMEKWTVTQQDNGYMIFTESGEDVVDFAWMTAKYPKQIAAAHNQSLQQAHASEGTLVTDYETGFKDVIPPAHASEQ